MKINWGKVAQYGIPLAMAAIGYTGGYNTPRTETAPTKSPAQPQQALQPIVNCNPPVIDLSKLKLPACPACPACPSTTIDGLRR